MYRTIETLIGIVIHTGIALALAYVASQHNDAGAPLSQDPVENWIAIGVAALLLEQAWWRWKTRKVDAFMRTLAGSITLTENNKP
jgi:membrane protein DedA with SNARE-associated domain